MQLQAAHFLAKTGRQAVSVWYNENGFLDDMIGGIGSHEHLA
jgi:hypothetical protein